MDNRFVLRVRTNQRRLSFLVFRVNKLIHVAVGVIIGSNGEILIAKRPQTSHQGGLWEFPGGKVDAGESVVSALRRELMEELSIQVTSAEPLIQIRHDYPDKSVLLDVYVVRNFDGEPAGAEGQPIKWVKPADLTQYEFPAANKPIITAVRLPNRYLITGHFFDEGDFIRRLENAFAQGIQLAQMRIPNLDASLHGTLLNRAFSLAKKNSAHIVLNTDVSTFEKIQCDYPSAEIGLHFNSHRAATTSVRPISPDCLFGISCHNESDIRHAEKIGADYLLLSPVKPTASHPGAPGLGWEKFEKLVALAKVPVYALGGVGDDDIKLAVSSGAQGVAGISAWW